MAVKTVADTLSERGDVFARDDDPELVRDAVPFALKTYESLLESVPRHRPLLLATCSGFTQYAFAFVQTDADLIGSDDYDRAAELKARALNLYLRGRSYCLRALELKQPGIERRLLRDPAPALARFKIEDLPLLYWTGASWGAALSIGLDRPDLVIGFPAVRALIDRALALDETYSNGAIHELLITLESVPEALGGSAERARAHFVRASALQKGSSAGPYVALALGVALPNQDRVEFESLLKQALAVDPNAWPGGRLANLIAQRRARRLLDRIDELIPAAPMPR